MGLKRRDAKDAEERSFGNQTGSKAFTQRASRILLSRPLSLSDLCSAIRENLRGLHRFHRHRTDGRAAEVKSHFCAFCAFLWPFLLPAFGCGSAAPGLCV